MIQTLIAQHLSSEAIHTLVVNLPDYVKVALLAKAEELECPLEGTIKMAFMKCL